MSQRPATMPNPKRLRQMVKDALTLPDPDPDQVQPKEMVPLLDILRAKGMGWEEIAFWIHYHTPMAKRMSGAYWSNLRKNHTRED